MEPDSIGFDQSPELAPFIDEILQEGNNLLNSANDPGIGSKYAIDYYREEEKYGTAFETWSFFSKMHTKSVLAVNQRTKENAI